MQECLVAFYEENANFDNPVAMFIRTHNGSSVYMVKKLTKVARSLAVEDIAEMAQKFVEEFNAVQDAENEMLLPYDGEFDFNKPFAYCIYPSRIEAFDMRAGFKMIGTTSLWR